MNPQRTRLLELIAFVQHTATHRLAGGPGRETLGRFRLDSQQLGGAEGVRTGAAEPDDGAWLRVARPENPALPPRPESPWLSPWLDIGDPVLSSPRLATSVSGESLIAAGTHLDEEASAGADQATARVRRDAVVLLDGYAFRAQVERDLAAYLTHEWAGWAATETSRRRWSRLYMQFLTLHQELTGPGSDGQLELLWGVGLLSRPGAGAAASLPLIVQAVDLALDPATGAAVVSPRSSMPQMESEVLGITDRAMAARVERQVAEVLGMADEPFSPFEPRTWSRMLTVACEAAGLPEQPVFAEGWILFTRTRPSTPLVKDLEQFAMRLRSTDRTPALPSAVSALVSDPPEQTHAPVLPRYRGISASLATDEADLRDLHFPLPFNEEQMRVVQLLEAAPGVVVQGPPGTGKTHTIANIICHWLANGRRVLVTSMKEPALAVLRDKLPEEIRPLALSLLTGEPGGLGALEQAVETIAATVQRLDPVAESGAVERLEQTVDALHGRLLRIDVMMDELAQRQLAPIRLDGETVDPLDAALAVASEDSSTSWLPDVLGPEPEFAPLFDESDLDRLFKARAALGADIVHACARRPAVTQLPSMDSLLDAHRRLVRLAQLSTDGRTSDTPILAAGDADTQAILRQTGGLTETVRALRAELTGGPGWIAAVAGRLAGSEGVQALELLEAVGAELAPLTQLHGSLLARPVNLPPGAEFDNDLGQAVRNLAAGRRAFGLTSLFRPEARGRLAAITLEDRLPASPADWALVSDALALRAQWRTLMPRWNAATATLGLPAASAECVGGISEALQSLSVLRRVGSLRRAESTLAEQAQRLFPGWSLARRLRDEPAAIRGLERAVDHYLNAQQLADVWQVRNRLQELLGNAAGGVFEQLRGFSSGVLGNLAIDEKALVDRWFALCAEFSRLETLALPLDTVTEVTMAIERTGAPRLAARLREASPLERDALIPANWRQGWRLRRLRTHLETVAAGPQLLGLSGQRTEMERDLARAYRELVVRRSWLRLADQATPVVRAALQSYLGAVQRLGKGTGKRAARYRQDARESAAAAQAAVPCWIMPHHRIPESLPSELGAFDLVVIDEASQSDLSALPALLRGARFLIVGDDKQVSPDPVGLDEDRIRALVQAHLPSQVPLYRMQMSPERSIYDLARVVFASSSVMLKEHFRCIAPIIEYSKREFYGDELRPLRLPTRSHRLDPPLIDIMIEGATRQGDVNLAEVEAIVAEIASLTTDPRTRGRSVGVVSLLGEEQAARIRDRLADRLGPAVLLEHALVCGDAKALQGRERDIVFLSMVVAPNDVGAPLARDTFAQRFNVAASRARERMVLVRSVEPGHLPDSDRLRLGLIAHFRQPFGVPARVDAAPRERCETMLERALFDWLADRGYRVAPRVMVGAWSIDLVVEGARDQRIAIECDGDRHVGAGYWLDDIRRQRVLERMGWVFWRCFATRFVMDREAVLGELESILHANGIRPGGESAADEALPTRHLLLRVEPAAAGLPAGRHDNPTPAVQPT